MLCTRLIYSFHKIMPDAEHLGLRGGREDEAGKPGERCAVHGIHTHPVIPDPHRRPPARPQKNFATAAAAAAVAGTAAAAGGGA